MLDIQQIYAKNFEGKRYHQAKDKCDEVLNEWIQFRNKIINKTFTIDDYTNDVSNGNYLTNYLEKTSTIFGKSSIGGSANRGMVKRNIGSDTFMIIDENNHNKVIEVSRPDAESYFNNSILPLFENIIASQTIGDLKEIEDSTLYKNYIPKQLLEKAMVLESKVKNCEYSFKLLEIYDHASITFIYKNILGLNGSTHETEQCYLSSLALYNCLGIKLNALSEKEVYEVSKMAWDLYDKQNNYLQTEASINNDPIQKRLSDEIKNDHKQIILTGAPGTGKTYSARAFVDKVIDKGTGVQEFVQFHPSYDYSDFVEGLRPVILSGTTNNKPTFVKIDGIFKEFCRKVVMNNYDEICELYPNEDQDFYKIYLAHEKEIVTKHFFIIDEINRADLSKVFGELMFGLEETYRGINNSFATQYVNLDTYEVDDNGMASKMDFDCFKERFFIPHNIYIIGTMNDIDKSVEAFDFALRRRFQWIEIKADDVVEQALQSMGYQKKQSKKLASAIKNMNEVITKQGQQFGLSEAYHIGHAYFKGVDFDNYDSSLKELFDSNIVSILKEYTRGRNKTDVGIFLENCKNALLGVTNE